MHVEIEKRIVDESGWPERDYAVKVDLSDVEVQRLYSDHWTRFIFSPNVTAPRLADIEGQLFDRSSVQPYIFLDEKTGENYFRRSPAGQVAYDSILAAEIIRALEPSLLSDRYVLCPEIEKPSITGVRWFDRENGSYIKLNPMTDTGSITEHGYVRNERDIQIRPLSGSLPTGAIRVITLKPDSNFMSIDIEGTVIYNLISVDGGTLTTFSDLVFRRVATPEVIFDSETGKISNFPKNIKFNPSVGFKIPHPTQEAIQAAVDYRELFDQYFRSRAHEWVETAQFYRAGMERGVTLLGDKSSTATRNNSVIDDIFNRHNQAAMTEASELLQQRLTELREGFPEVPELLRTLPENP